MGIQADVKWLNTSIEEVNESIVLIAELKKSQEALSKEMFN